MEKRYLDLENQIKREIEIPNEKYAVSMTVIKKEDYDPINGTLYPVFPALLQEDKEQEKTEPMPCLIYFAGSYQKKEEFEKTAEIFRSSMTVASPILSEYGRQNAISRRCQSYIRYLSITRYAGRQSIRDIWTDSEVYTDGDTDANSLKIDFGSYEEDIKMICSYYGMLKSSHFNAVNYGSVY